MKKDKIREILRENLFSKLKEAEPIAAASKEAPKAEPADKDNKSFERDYNEVQRKLTNTLLKQSQVMAAAGLGKPEDATDRSLFSKKVRKDSNDEGGLYMFDEKELAAVLKVINNPASYLNVKNK